MKWIAILLALTTLGCIPEIDNPPTDSPEHAEHARHWFLDQLSVGPGADARDVPLVWVEGKCLESERFPDNWGCTVGLASLYSGGRWEVYLGENERSHPGVLYHELMHVLGYGHEDPEFRWVAPYADAYFETYGPMERSR